MHSLTKRMNQQNCQKSLPISISMRIYTIVCIDFLAITKSMQYGQLKLPFFFFECTCILGCQNNGSNFDNDWKSTMRLFLKRSLSLLYRLNHNLVFCKIFFIDIYDRETKIKKDKQIYINKRNEGNSGEKNINTFVGNQSIFN